MTQPTSSRLSDLSKTELIALLDMRLEAASKAEMALNAANAAAVAAAEQVDEIMRFLRKPLPPRTRGDN